MLGPSGIDRGTRRGSITQTLNTGTAADLLHFETIHHVTKNCDALTRVATANENWIVKDWDGETYCIRFASNFSKKHLFTFSKKHDRTVQKSSQLAALPARAGKSDAENWHDAEMELLTNKIAKNLNKRAVADMCQCGHAFNRHLAPNVAPPPPKVPAPCRDCGCTPFRTPYGIARQYVGKPTHDPLAGAKTTTNTCIILNWVPKAEFESVVVQSIQAVEKPPGWTRGQPLAVHVNNSQCLKWDFTGGRHGAIIVARKDVAGVFSYANYQGCWVQAKKTASTVGRQTWEIYHMDTGSAPNPHSPPNHLAAHNVF